MLSDDELDLVERCRRGDRRAWATLYETYARDVEMFVRGVLGQRADAEDLVQQVFLELLASLDRFRGQASLRTWLHRIAHNLVRKHFRSSARRARHMSALAEVGPRHAADAHGVTEARAHLELIEAALDDLKLDFRVVWVMRELEDMSVDEVADALGLRKATVRSRHFRARGAILDALEAAERSPRGQAAGARSTSVVGLVALLLSAPGGPGGAR